jgi:hypothetical protein
MPAIFSPSANVLAKASIVTLAGVMIGGVGWWWL